MTAWRRAVRRQRPQQQRRRRPAPLARWAWPVPCDDADWSPRRGDVTRALI